jgi:hypothetical protein
MWNPCEIHASLPFPHDVLPVDPSLPGRIFIGWLPTLMSLAPVFIISIFLSIYLSTYLPIYLSICLSILNHVLVVHACVYIYMYIKIDCICWHAVADIIVSPSVWSSKNPWTQRRGKCGVVGTRFQLPGVSLDLDELEGPDTKTNEAFLAWRWNQ